MPTIYNTDLLFFLYMDYIAAYEPNVEKSAPQTSWILPPPMFETEILKTKSVHQKLGNLFI